MPLGNNNIKNKVFLILISCPKIDFVWSDECQGAFESAKSLLCHTPCSLHLSWPDLSNWKLGLEQSWTMCRVWTTPFAISPASLTKISSIIPLLKRKPWVCCWLFSTSKFTCSPVFCLSLCTLIVFLSRIFNHNQGLMWQALLTQEYTLVIQHKKGTENILADDFFRLYDFGFCFS